MCNLAFLKISICLEVILTMILHLLIESMSDGALKNVLLGSARLRVKQERFRKRRSRSPCG